MESVTWLQDRFSLCVLQGADGESGAQGKQGGRGLKVSEGHSAVTSVEAEGPALAVELQQ